MDKDHIIKVVLAVYRVTDVFPANEPLKTLIREKANQILADLILERDKEEIKKSINLIQSYFEIAEEQNWLEEANFLVLEDEYGKIEQALEEKKETKKREEDKEEKKKKEEKKENKREKNELTEREGRILSILRDKKKIQVWELKKIFPSLTKRTLRRDFDNLLRMGLVERRGSHNNVYYILSNER